MALHLRSFLRFSLVVTLLAINLYNPLAQAQQPSFNCSRSTSIDEVAICSNATLSQLDRQLQSLYLGVVAGLDQRDVILLRDTQRFWLVKRGTCGQNTGCIAALYRARIPQLQELLAGGSGPISTGVPEPASPPPSPGTPRDACAKFPTLCTP
jgi:uncharacterized protein